MAEPFEDRSDGRSSLASRVLGRRSRAAAAREIEELLARAGRVTEVDAASVAAVAERHATDVAPRLRTPCRNLYRRYLEFCLLDQALSEEEIEDLAHLRSILGLAEEDVEGLHDDVARAVYGTAVEQVLEDQRIDAEERSFLRRLRDGLRLAEATAESAVAEEKRRARQRFLSRVASRESALVADRGTPLELTGSSETTMEEAVNAALGEACAALPELREVALADVRAEVADGRVTRWHVTVRGTIGGV